jgi:hypothetical protein
MAAGLNNLPADCFRAGRGSFLDPYYFWSEPVIPEKPGPDANLKPGQPDAIPTPNRPEIPSTPPTDFPEIPKPQPPQSPFPAHPEQTPGQAPTKPPASSGNTLSTSRS